MSNYFLQRTAPNWAGFGGIMVHGITGDPIRVHGRLQLYRAGPVIPPFSMPGINDVVVTSEIKGFLQERFSGLAFLPVDKVRITALRWEDWLPVDDALPFDPQGMEPESYLLKCPHDPQAASEMGDLWELLVPTVRWITELSDWGRIVCNRRLVISERAKEMLRDRCGPFLALEPAS